MNRYNIKSRKLELNRTTHFLLRCWFFLIATFSSNILIAISGNNGQNSEAEKNRKTEIDLMESQPKAGIKITTEHFIQIDFHSYQRDFMTLYIYNSDHQLITSVIKIARIGFNKLELKEIGLCEGTYYAHISFDNGNTLIRRFEIKELLKNNQTIKDPYEDYAYLWDKVDTKHENDPYPEYAYLWSAKPKQENNIRD